MRSLEVFERNTLVTSLFVLQYIVHQFFLSSAVSQTVLCSLPQTPRVSSSKDVFISSLVAGKRGSGGKLPAGTDWSANFDLGNSTSSSGPTLTWTRKVHVKYAKFDSCPQSFSVSDVHSSLTLERLHILYLSLACNNTIPPLFHFQLSLTLSPDSREVFLADEEKRQSPILIARSKAGSNGPPQPPLCRRSPCRFWDLGLSDKRSQVREPCTSSRPSWMNPNENPCWLADLWRRPASARRTTP